MDMTLEEFIELLQDIKEDVDFENCTTLIDDHVLDSFDILSTISALNEGMIRFPGVELIACRDHQVVQTTANRIIEFLPGGSYIDKVTDYDSYLESDADARKRTVYVSDFDEDEN